MYKNISEFIDRLEQNGELIRVRKEVSTELEMTEIADRQAKLPGGGKALLFEKTGTEFPVLMNMMGSHKRLCMALGTQSIKDVGDEILELFKMVTSPKPSLLSKIALLPQLGKISRWLPKNSAQRGSCQEIILSEEQVDLDKLPILKCWTHDGGRFITLPLVHTIDPETGARNVGMYRMQQLSKTTTGLHWHTHKTGARHYEQYRKRGEMMPVTVCLGGDPIYTYSATAPVPDGIDEYLLAGFLRKKPVRLVKCITNDIRVPEDCDFVMEGYVDPSEVKVLEGPFGDHTGFYSLEDFFPRFHITCITHRKNAVYPATIVGIPPQEDAYISEATEAIFLEPIRLVMQPEMVDMYMPPAGVAHNIALVSITKSYAGQAFKVASGLWGAGQMMFNKFVMIADDDCDIRSVEDIAARVRGVDIERDLLFSKGVLDILDHSSQVAAAGGKLAVDLTAKLEEEGAEYDDEEYYSVPEVIVLPMGFTDISDALVEQWNTLLIKADRTIDDQEQMSGAVEELILTEGLAGIKFIVIVDEQVDFEDLSTLVWLMGGNVDPQRDIFIEQGVLAIDARAKYDGINGFNRRWPNVVVMDNDIIERVDNRWDELDLGEFVESPSRRFEALVLSDGASV